MKKKPKTPANERLRALPGVTDVLAHPVVAALLEAVPRPIVISAIQSGIDSARKELLAGS